MKTLYSSVRATLLGVLLIVGFPCVGLAADNPPAAAATQAQPSELSKTRDAFLVFVLDKAKTYSDKAEVAVSKAVDVVSAEAPLVVQEFLTWRSWMHGFKALGTVVLLVIGLILFFGNVLKWSTSTQYYSSYLTKGTQTNVILTAVGAAASLVGFVMFVSVGLSNLMSFIQIVVAPRVYLIEEALVLFK